MHRTRPPTRKLNAKFARPMAGQREDDTDREVRQCAVSRSAESKLYGFAGTLVGYRTSFDAGCAPNPLSPVGEIQCPLHIHYTWKGKSIADGFTGSCA